MSPKSKKPYWKMTTEELAQATKEFDRPIPAHKFKPLTPEQRRRWERARRQPATSIYILDDKKGKREVAILALDAELMRRAHEYARLHDISWDQLISRALRHTLTMPEKKASRRSA